MTELRDKIQALLGELEAINVLSSRTLMGGAMNGLSDEGVLRAINFFGPVREITRERAWRILNEIPYLCRPDCPECLREEGILTSFRWMNITPHRKTPHRLNPRAPCFVMRNGSG